MYHNAPSIGPVLDDGVLARMQASAFEMLARTGLAVEHPEIRARILEHPGFTADGRRVRITPESVESWLREHPDRPGIPQPSAAPVAYTYSAADYAGWVVGSDLASVRPMTRADVVAGARLLRALAPRGVNPGVPGVPCDVPAPLRPLEQFLIGCEVCPEGAGTPFASDIATAEVIREMERVLGRPLSTSVWCPSPLVLGGPRLDALWHFRAEVASVLVASMPMMGFTAPCDPLATMTLALAEILGGAAILHALLPGVPVSIFPHPEPAEMSTGAMAIGSPEWELLDLMHRDVLSYYHIAWNSKLLHTSASLPGAQAQIERTTGALLGVLGGYRHFSCLGTIGVDEVWCPAQVLLDLEIVEHADRVGRGAYSDPVLRLDGLADLVDEVVRSGEGFAGHASTVAAFRRQYHFPRILQRAGLAQWRAAGEPDVLRDAQHRAEALSAACEPAPAPEDVLRELRAVYRRGAERLPAR